MSEEAKNTKSKALSKFKVKDKFFDKKISKIMKNRTTQMVDCDFRNLVIGNKKLKLFKGVPLTKEELSVFDSTAKEYWLTNV